MKFLTMLIILAMVSACSDDDSSNKGDEQQETGFFSQDVLKVGNKWVYWHYDIENYAENPDEIVYTGEVDSIEVTGQGEYNGISYSILKTRNFNADGELNSESISHQRITPSTHWVHFDEDHYPEDEEDGDVLHPGEDWTYVREVDYEPYGTMELHLYETTTVNIDGTNYEVATYKGVFTPNDNYPEMTSKTVEYNYNKDIGKVNYLCHFLLDPGAFGARLISFTPGN